MFVTSQDSARTKTTYFAVKAKILNCLKHSGLRRRIYEDAQTYRACYDFRSSNQSIWYPQDSKDLHISLLFKAQDEAHDFVGCLITYNLGHGVLRDRIQINESIDVFDSDAQAHFVYKSHYVSDESVSPPDTPSVSSATEVANSGNPELQLRSLEDLSKLVKGEPVNRCHIAPKAFFPQWKSDPDNIIYGSHLFHHFLDGDGKRRPSDAHSSWGTPPYFKIQYDSTGDGHMRNGTVYRLINVVVTFQDPEIARAMEGRWREGTATLDQLSFRTFFYTTNVANAIEYLGCKQKETETRWQDPSEFEV
jgi:hypothetical protein